MASDTVSARNDEADLALTWSGRWTLGHRILAVNVLTLVFFALTLLYLDAYRNQLLEERQNRLVAEARLAARAIDHAAPTARADLLRSIGADSDARLRIYDSAGARVADSWTGTAPTYRLRDPTTEAWRKDAARALDRGFNALVGARPPDDFIEPAVDRASAWPEVVDSRRQNAPVALGRQAPDLTPVLSTAAPLMNGATLLMTTN